MSYASDALIDAQEREIKKLKAENAKLRELCADMYEYASTLGYEHPLLQELGIEVGE